MAPPRSAKVTLSLALLGPVQLTSKSSPALTFAGALRVALTASTVTGARASTVLPVR